MALWQKNLETMGAELFQRYRKRLMSPGIVMEMHRDYPGLSIVDVLIRVHAGRRIIEDGDDFLALRAIRSGQWQRIRGQQGCGQPLLEARRDRISRILVTVGAVLFTGFCLLTLSVLLSAGAGQWLMVVSGLTLMTALLWRLEHSRSTVCLDPVRPGCVDRRKHTHRRHDAAASV